MNSYHTYLTNMKGRGPYRRGLSERNVDQLDGSLSLSDDEVDFRSYENAQPPVSVLDEKLSENKQTNYPGLASYETAHPPVSVLDEKLSENKQTNYPGLAKLSAASYREKSHQEAGTKLTIDWYMIGVILIIIMLLLGIQQSWAPANKSTVTNNILQYSEDLKILGKKFNLPKDSLLKIKVGVNIIHTKRSAGSFIILYNSGDNNFQRSQFNEMINDIANATAKYLRNGSGSFIELESNNLKVANHEELLYKYGDTLLESGVMLVKDLDILPTNLAMAFHYFCDEYAPLVKKTAIFFTIDKLKCSINSNSELHKWIERCLADKWRQLREDSISPLLARVVEIVVEV